MKISDNLIRILNVSISAKNNESRILNETALGEAKESWLKKHSRLIEKRKAVQVAVGLLDKQLGAVGISFGYRNNGASVCDEAKAEIRIKKIQRVSPEVVLAQIAKADEKEGKKILLENGVNI